MLNFSYRFKRYESEYFSTLHIRIKSHIRLLSISLRCNAFTTKPIVVRCKPSASYNTQPHQSIFELTSYHTSPNNFVAETFDHALMLFELRGVFHDFHIGPMQMLNNISPTDLHSFHTRA